MSRKERTSKGVTSLSKDRIFPGELLKSRPGNIHVIDGKYFLHLTDEEIKLLKAENHQE